MCHLYNNVYDIHETIIEEKKSHQKILKIFIYTKEIV